METLRAGHGVAIAAERSDARFRLRVDRRLGRTLVKETLVAVAIRSALRHPAKRQHGHSTRQQRANPEHGHAAKGALFGKRHLTTHLIIDLRAYPKTGTGTLLPGACPGFRIGS